MQCKNSPRQIPDIVIWVFIFSLKAVSILSKSFVTAHDNQRNVKLHKFINFGEPTKLVIYPCNVHQNLLLTETFSLVARKKLIFNTHFDKTTKM